MKYRVEIVQRFYRRVTFIEENDSISNLDEAWDKIDGEYQRGFYDKLLADTSLIGEEPEIEVEDAD